MALESRKKSTIRTLTEFVAVSMVLFQLYTAATVPLRTFMQDAAHLGFALLIIFLTNRLTNKGVLGRILDWVLMVAAIAFNLKMLIAKGEVSHLESFHLSTPNFILASLAIVVVLEASRRCTKGMALPMVVTVFLTYAFIGPYLPGLLGHSGASLERVLSTSYLTVQGIYGVALDISAVDIFSLVAFGAFLFCFGGGDFIMDLAKYLVGGMVGGLAKVAVISSFLFGTISGSGPANAAATGTFTIPLMKKMGYKPEFAGAVESAASVGGQIAPPVMGAASFIMAEALNVPYARVMLAALIPAILYYGAVFLAVDSEARKLGLKPLPQEQTPSARQVFYGRFQFISLGVLLYLLIFKEFGPAASGFWAIVSVVVISVTQETVITHGVNIRRLGQNLVKASLQAAESGALIAVASAAAGIIIGVVDLSGLAIKITASLVDISAGSVILLLFFAMVASLILGMGLPTVVCYIIVASLVVPALVKMGITPIAAHLFSFFFAIMSNLTPPVALTAYVAAGIAGSSPLRTAVIGTRLGMMGFALPFVFVFRTGLVFEGTGWDVIYAILIAILATGASAFGLSGFFLHRLRMVERILLVGAGITLLWPTHWMDAFGSLLLIAGILLVLRNQRKETEGQRVIGGKRK